MLLKRRVSLHELLTRFRNQPDDATMEEFVARTRPRLLAIARRIGARQDAEDSVQAAYHALLARSDDAPAIVPEAWLTTTVVRIAYRRKAVARRYARLADQLARARSDTDPVAAASRSDEAAVLREGVTRLPSRYRDPIVLHHLEGLPIQEIARLLDDPIPTVKTRLRRGRALLRGKLPHSLARALFIIPWLVADAARAGTAPALAGGGIVKAKTAVITVTLAIATGVGGYLAGTQVNSTDVARRRAEPRPSADVIGDPATRESMTFDGLVASVPVPPTATGNGVITGRVATVDGDAVPGAVIEARPGWTPEGGERWFTPDASLEESIRGLIASRKWRDAGLRTATTAADGTYRLTGLASNNYSLVPRCEGYAIRAKRGSRAYAKPGATVDFEAEARVEVRTEITGMDSDAADYVTVYYRFANRRVGYSPLSWRPTKPILRFPAGKLSIYATAGPAKERKSEVMEVTFVAKTSPTLTIRLKERPGVRGKLLVPPVLRPPYVYLYLGSFEGDRAPEGPIPVSGMKSVQAREETGYPFEFIDVAPGRYLIGASVDGRTLESPELIEIPDRMMERDVKLAMPDPKLYRVVRVLKGDGEPALIRSFMLRFHSERGGGAGPCTWIKRADGSHFVRTRNLGWATSLLSMKDVKYTLTITTEDHGGITRDFDAHAPGEFVVRVAEPATVSVTLDGYRGSGYEGRILLRAKPAGEPRVQHATLPSGITSLGKRTLGPLQSGEAVLLIGTNQNRLFWIVARVPMVLKPGENNINVPMPALHKFKVRGKEGTRLRISPVGKDYDLLLLYIYIGEEGDVEVSGFAAGRYEISWHRDGKRWKREFTLPGTSVIGVR